MPCLLVVDDETAILHAFRRAFGNSELSLITAQTGADALNRVREQKPDVVVLDINLPDRTGLDVFREIQSGDARIPVIFITGHGTTDTAIEAIKLGAFDYLLKPLELDQVEEVVERALEISRRMRTPAITSEEPFQEEADLIVGRSPQMQEVLQGHRTCRRAGRHCAAAGRNGDRQGPHRPRDLPACRRAAGPFLAVNCAAIPDALLESELFGHEKGAFTGADRRRIGKFEQCSGGTLFLDEIGDMTPLTQAKVLRVLQDQTFERVGGSQLLKTDVRVIAATNRDLAELARQGEFRSDLYYRLSVFTMTLPPLRERGEDIILLVRHFLRTFSRELGKDVRDIDSEALAILTSYGWPGNVRELQSVVKQALLQATGAVLLTSFLPTSVFGGSKLSPARDGTDLDRLIDDGIQAADERLYGRILETVRRKLVARALEETSGNQLRAAKLLGITRGTLRSELRALGISVTRQVTPPDAEQS